MSSPDEQHETDDRFPTGPWIGFFLQPDSSQRHRMDLSLQFAQDRITGEGYDWVGEFTIAGTYNTKTGDCSWTKHYLGQHSVNYAGQARHRGIVGQWQIPELSPFWTGPFFVWPRAYGDLGADFERVFLEYELSAPCSDRPSELVEV